MKRSAKIVLFAMAAAVAATGIDIAPASAIYVYPSKGQSEDQMQRDKFDCSQWATQQTGFDPTNPQRVQTTQTQPRGGALRGAAGGAALGAIGGDAGKGAAIGAGVGAGVGMMRRNRSIREQQQEQAQINQNYNAQINNYNDAYGTCLKGKGYSVG